MLCGNNGVYVFLNNGCPAVINLIDLGLINIDTYHLMTILGQTPKAHASYVAKTKNTDVHVYCKVE
ncbi:hypothetical protein GCM10028825_38000 [Spirosoma agri]